MGAERIESAFAVQKVDASDLFLQPAVRGRHSPLSLLICSVEKCQALEFVVTAWGFRRVGVESDDVGGLFPGDPIRLKGLSDKVVILVVVSRAASRSELRENVLDVEGHTLGGFQLEVSWILAEIFAVQTEVPFLLRKVIIVQICYSRLIGA